MVSAVKSEQLGAEFWSEPHVCISTQNSRKCNGGPSRSQKIPNIQYNPRTIQTHELHGLERAISVGDPGLGTPGSLEQAEPIFEFSIIFWLTSVNLVRHRHLPQVTGASRNWPWAWRNYFLNRSLQEMECQQCRVEYANSCNQIRIWSWTQSRLYVKYAKCFWEFMIRVCCCKLQRTPIVMERHLLNLAHAPILGIIGFNVLDKYLLYLRGFCRRDGVEHAWQLKLVR